MKLLPIVIMLGLLAACGKTSSTNSSSDPKDGQEREEQQNGYVNLHPDQHRPTELLNVTLAEEIRIAGDEIIFSRPQSKVDQGARINCSMSIKPEESIRYQVRGSRLLLQFSNGLKLTMQRTGSSGNGVIGSWLAVNSGNNIKITRRFTILEDRMVMNQDCEG